MQGKPQLVLIVASVVAYLLTYVVTAQTDIDPERYAKVKAGFLLNFARYAEWPAQSFADDQAPLVITIVGRDRMTPDFERLVSDERVHDRRIEVRVLEHPQGTPPRPVDDHTLHLFHERLLESHVLFLATTEERRYLDVLDLVEEKNILTVSDIEDFGEAGGMLGLAVESGRVVFDANPGEIEKNELRVSSKLLRLARIVETREDRR